MLEILILAFYIYCNYWLGRVLISLQYSFTLSLYPDDPTSWLTIYIQWFRQFLLTRLTGWGERRWGGRGWPPRGECARPPQSRTAGASVWSCPRCGSSSPCRGWSSCCNRPRRATWHWGSPVITMSRMSVTLITSPVTERAYCPPGSWETNCSWTR